MKCPDMASLLKVDASDKMQLYQEALSCLELIASNLEKQKDYPVVDSLYERCSSAISTLRQTQPNPLIASSLESLLETVTFQQSLLEAKHNKSGELDLRRTVDEGAFSYSGQGSAYLPAASSHSSGHISVEDMLVSPSQLENLSFDSVVGLQEAKQTLQEAVFLPAKYPQLFNGATKPWSRILLYGPPGTGKTKLAKALAAELACSFYSVTSASLLSSWIGESEKLIEDLFNHARSQPGQSVIFIDEIDCFCRKRSKTEDEHSRRVKTELLRQLDGFTSPSSQLFVLGATNCPWDLDPAFLRRFQKHIYIPLPDRENRRNILMKQFEGKPLQLEEEEWNVLLDATAGFSGADLSHVAMAAAFQPIRDLQSARFWRFTQDNKITPCSSDTLGAMQYTLSKLPADKVLARQVNLADFNKALSTTSRSNTPELLQLYDSYMQNQM